jgi:hypothetical protein
MAPTPPFPADPRHRPPGPRRSRPTPFLSWLAPGAATCAMAVHLVVPTTSAHLAARPPEVRLPEVRPCQVALATRRHNQSEAAGASLSSVPLRWLPASLEVFAIPAPAAAPWRAGLREIIVREDQAAAAASARYRMFARPGRQPDACAFRSYENTTFDARKPAGATPLTGG